MWSSEGLRIVALLVAVAVERRVLCVRARGRAGVGRAVNGVQRGVGTLVVFLDDDEPAKGACGG